MSVICRKVIGWFWLLCAFFWLFVLGQSVRAMFASPGTPAFQHSEWSPLTAGVSATLLLLFSLSGLALVLPWRSRWWWQIPAVLALICTGYLFCNAYLA